MAKVPSVDRGFGLWKRDPLQRIEKIVGVVAGRNFARRVDRHLVAHGGSICRWLETRTHAAPHCQLIQRVQITATRELIEFTAHGIEERRRQCRRVDYTIRNAITSPARSGTNPDSVKGTSSGTVHDSFLRVMVPVLRGRR